MLLCVTQSKPAEQLVWVMKHVKSVTGENSQNSFKLLCLVFMCFYLV